MTDRASGAVWRRRQRRTVLVVATRAADIGCGDPPFVLQGGHCERRLSGQKIGTSTGVGPAEYFELSTDDGRPTAGMRPASMLEPWPQGKVERRSGIRYELVQALDAPVLQMVEQLPDAVLRHKGFTQKTESSSVC